MKFSEFPYERVTLAEAKTLLDTHLERLSAAETPDGALKVLREMDKASTHLSTMYALAYIRNTQDTENAFFEAEQAYWDETLPQLQELDMTAAKAVLSNPHRAALEKELGGVYFKLLELSLKVFSPEIIPQLQEENRLCTEYQKLMASAQIEYDGRMLTLSQLAPYHQDRDRAVRKSSMEARCAWLMAQTEKLDELFDRLVALRTDMAARLGYKSFIEMGYDRMQRLGYDAEMVKSFRQNILTKIVPEAAALKEEQRSRIGVERLTPYDDAFVFPGGNPKPKGTPEEIFAAGRAMYHAMSEETAEFIDFMLETELFDVLSRKGKAGGGYCYDLQEFSAPFIFANFNGTAGDIDVLTHEAGHALAAYMARDIEPSALRSATSETCEVHSMSMEFFAYPYMDSFFGDEADKYRKAHYAEAVTFLPYGTMVDHFQHIVYEKPEMTPGERNAVWKELETQYRPWLDNGVPFFEEGRRWQTQAHIYERPFYYIDYCLAQTVALNLYKLSQKQYAEAWRRYIKLVSLGGKEAFLDLLLKCGMESPFIPS